MRRRVPARAIITVLILVLSAAAGCRSPEEKFQVHMKRAQAYFDAGDFQEARIELLNALEQDPSSSSGYFLLGKALTGMKDYSRAAAAFANANRLAPEDREVALHFGRFLVAGNAYSMAESVASAWVDKSPGDADFLILLSLAKAQGGKTDEAVRLARKAVELVPDSADAWLNMGRVSLMKKDYEGALAAISRVEGLDPSSEEAVFLKVSLLGAQGRTRDALGELEALAAGNPGRADIKARLARLYEDMGEKEKALGIYRELAAEEPNASVLYRLGLLQYDAGQRDEALDSWKESAEADPYFPPPRIALARHYLSEKEIPKALKTLDEALEFAPQSREALALRGEVHLSQGDAGRAVPDFQEALRASPESVDLKFALARAQLAAGEVSQSRENLRAVVQKRPGHAQANLLLAQIEANGGNLMESSGHARAATMDEKYGREAMWVLGDNAIRQGRFREAQAVFGRALKRHGPHPMTRYRLARSMELLGDLEGAEREYRGLVREDPGDIRALTRLVAVLGQSGREEEALALARERAQEGVPQRMLLGQVLEGTGNYGEAREVYLGVIEESPELLTPYRRVVALYSRESKLEEAEEWLGKSIEDQKKPPAGLPFLLGMVQDALGDRESSTATYRRILEASPEFVPAMNNLAWNLSESGDLEEALRIAARARTLAPEEPNLADTYGWILHRSGDSAGALSPLRKAVEALPDNETVRMHLVEALRALGREDEARKQLEILQESRPGLPNP